MKRIEEMSMKELSGLSEETMQHYLSIRMMEEGIILPPRPTAPVRPDFESLKTQTVYEVGNNFYVDAEDAKAVAKYPIARLDYEYKASYEHKYVSHSERQPIQEHMVVPKELYLSKVEELTKANREKEAYEAADRAYKAEKKKVDALYDEILGRYHEALSEKHEVERILSIFEEYKTLAEGDEETAFRFLWKAFGEARIQKVYEWEPDALPRAVSELPSPVEADEDDEEKGLF